MTVEKVWTQLGVHFVCSAARRLHVRRAELQRPRLTRLKSLSNHVDRPEVYAAVRSRGVVRRSLDNLWTNRFVDVWILWGQRSQWGNPLIHEASPEAMPAFVLGQIGGTIGKAGRVSAFCVNEAKCCVSSSVRRP
jgi:hypothetical protein